MAQAAPKRKLSVLKRARQERKRNLRNRSVNSQVKTYTRKVLTAIDAGDREQVEKTLREAVKVIDSAASKGVLHLNTASRKISRLSKRANSALRPSTA